MGLVNLRARLRFTLASERVNARLSQRAITGPARRNMTYHDSAGQTVADTFA